MKHRILSIGVLAIALGGHAISPADEADLSSESMARRETAPESATAPPRDGEPTHHVVPLAQRQSVHESITRLMQLRRTQARQDPEQFWKDHAIGGREDAATRLVSLHAEDAPLLGQLQSVGEMANVRFEIPPGLEERTVNVRFEDKPLPEALKLIARSAEVVPIYDRFNDSYILVDLRERQPIAEVADFALPVLHSDPAEFLAFARKLGFDPVDGAIAINDDNNGYLYTGKVENLRQLRAFLRDFDRRPPREGESFIHKVVELKHQNPRGLVLRLHRGFQGNFSTRGQKLGIIVAPDDVDAVLAVVAEYDRPAGEE